MSTSHMALFFSRGRGQAALLHNDRKALVQKEKCWQQTTQKVHRGEESAGRRGTQLDTQLDMRIVKVKQETVETEITTKVLHFLDGFKSRGGPAAQTSSRDLL